MALGDMRGAVPRVGPEMLTKKRGGLLLEGTMLEQASQSSWSVKGGPSWPAWKRPLWMAHRSCSESSMRSLLKIFSRITSASVDPVRSHLASVSLRWSKKYRMCVQKSARQGMRGK